MEQIESYFNLPERCYANTFIPKKAFIENPEFNMTSVEKDVLKESVKNIYALYSVTPDSTGIPAYEDEDVRYKAIQITKVKLKDEKRSEKVCQIIQKYVHTPMLLLVEHEEHIRFNVGIKRVHKTTKEHLVVEEMLYTDWMNTEELTPKDIGFLESLDVRKKTTTNLAKVFEGIVGSINSYNLSAYRSEFKEKSEEETQQDLEVMKQLEALEKQEEVLKQQMKKESNIGAKVDLNIKIKKIQKEIQQLQEKMK